LITPDANRRTPDPRPQTADPIHHISHTIHPMQAIELTPGQTTSNRTSQTRRIRQLANTFRDRDP